MAQVREREVLNLHVGGSILAPGESIFFEARFVAFFFAFKANFSHFVAGVCVALSYVLKISF